MKFRDFISEAKVDVDGYITTKKEANLIITALKKDDIKSFSSKLGKQKDYAGIKDLSGRFIFEIAFELNAYKIIQHYIDEGLLIIRDMVDCRSLLYAIVSPIMKFGDKSTYVLDFTKGLDILLKYGYVVQSDDIDLLYTTDYKSTSKGDYWTLLRMGKDNRIKLCKLLKINEKEMTTNLLKFKEYNKDQHDFSKFDI